MKGKLLNSILRMTLLTIVLVLGTAPPQRAHPAAQTKALKIFFVLLEGNGKFGPKIGCNDSVVPVVIEVEPTSTPLKSAFEHLLAVKDDTYCETGLRNSLHQSCLKVESASISGQTAIIKLTGEYRDGGHCDTPRAEWQLKMTALQFPTVKKVKIYVNGELLTFDPT